MNIFLEDDVKPMALVSVSDLEKRQTGSLGDCMTSDGRLSCAQSLRAEPNPPPDGGLLAWSQVLGGFFLILNSRGLTNTFGVFQELYTNEVLRGSTPSEISCIGSLQTFLLMFGSAFCGRLLDAGHLRVTLTAGMSLEFFGMIGASYSTNYWQMLLSHGLCVGLGSGLLYLPSIVVISQYFSRRVMLATGIAATGSSISGIVYPIMVRRLVEHIYFPSAMRSLAILGLTLNCVSLALMRFRVQPRRSGPIFDISVFLDLPYLTFVMAMFLIFTAVYIPYFYIQDYAMSRGIDAELAFYLLTTMNATSLFGRVASGWIADRIGGLSVLIPCCLISGIAVLSWIFPMQNAVSIIAILTLFAFISAGLVALPPAIIAGLSKNSDECGTRIGMAFAVCAFGALAGNPIAGALLTATPLLPKGEILKPGPLPSQLQNNGRYDRSWSFAGVTLFVAGLLVASAKYLEGRATRERKLREAEIFNA